MFAVPDKMIARRSTALLAGPLMLAPLLAVGWGCADPTDPYGPDVEWNVANFGGAAGTPYVDQSMVITGVFDSDRLFAVDRVSGDLLWQTRLPIPGSFPYDGFGSSLAILPFGDLVIVNHGYVHAVRRETGSVVWSLTDRIVRSVVVNEGRLIAVGMRIHEVDPNTGVILQTHDVAEVASEPTLAEGVLYFGAQGVLDSSGGLAPLGPGHVTALDLESSTILWKHFVPNHPTGPWVGGVSGGGVLTDDLFIVASRNTRVHALDRWTGEERWMYEGSGPFTAGSITRLDDMVVVGGSSGVAEAIDLATGELRWQEPGWGSSISRGMSTVGSTVLVTAGRVMAYDSSGQYIWGFGGAGWDQPIISVSPTVHDGVMYATSVLDGLVAVRVPFR